jgi:hypothetical protein
MIDVYNGVLAEWSANKLGKRCHTTRHVACHRRCHLVLFCDAAPQTLITGMNLDTLFLSPKDGHAVITILALVIEKLLTEIPFLQTLAPSKPFVCLPLPSVEISALQQSCQGILLLRTVTHVTHELGQI